MPKLVAYGILSTTSKAMVGNLVKSQCDYCGKKYGSMEEAKKCEDNHIRNMLNNAVYKELFKRNGG